MEPNELMIGDYIRVIYTQKIIKVREIKQSCIYTHDNGYEYNEIEPIPLTLEILEKNGFEIVFDEDGTECYCYYNCAADGYIKISLYNGGDGDWRIEIVNYEKFDDNKIVYNNNFIFLKVHQLQHALRLCGIDKEIVL